MFVVIGQNTVHDFSDVRAYQRSPNATANDDVIGVGISSWY